MITKLEERGRLKADRYWPNKKKKPYEFDNEITVNLVSTEVCQEDLTKRGFEVSQKGMFCYETRECRRGTKATGLCFCYLVSDL